MAKRHEEFGVFVIGLRIPTGMTEEEVKDYLLEAVRSWAKTKDTKNPAYNLDQLSVAVAVVPEKEKEHVNQRSGDRNLAIA